MARRKRQFNVFSLSFLDAMTCGFGAIVLFFMIINASMGMRSGHLTGDLRADVDEAQYRVFDARRNLVELRNVLESTDTELVDAQGLAARIISLIEQRRLELADMSDETLSREEHLEQLKADLKSLEEETRRLAASAEEVEDASGDALRSFVGEGDRQYLTGLKIGGRRILILLDASASMLDETIVNVIRLRNMPDDEKIKAEKWQRAIRTIDWLSTQMPRDAKFQLYTFNETARPVIEGTDGEWLDAREVGLLNRAVSDLRDVVPGKGTSLLNAVRVIGTMDPRPDNVILITDGLPTMGDEPPARRTVSGNARSRLFARAKREVPRSLPVNVILFPMEGDPLAAAAYWKLARDTSGAFLSPTEDWP